jgi:ABC-2 type transport system permease protein
MPGLHQVYAQLMPFTHFLEGFIKLYQMGLSFKDVLPQAGVLALFILISVGVILTALKYRSRHILLQTKTV